MSTLSDDFDQLRYFRKKVDTSGGPEACWPWTGSHTGAGYGQIMVWGKSMLAHRYALELHTGKRLGAMLALHHCDNPPCCNPAHLYAGTYADNSADMVRRGRHVVQDRPTAMRRRAWKMNDDAVLALRRAAERGVSAKELSRTFGISHGYACALIARKNWAYLPSG